MSTAAPSTPWPEELRPRLVGLAYRIVGTMEDAEDLVQDAFLRWNDADNAAIERPFSWLATTVTRLAIDFMRSARVRRESYVGSWLPEPIVELGPATAPHDPVELAEDLTFALMLVLEQLGPKERAAFLLRDAFDLDYGEIADALDEQPANCRQLVSRARKRIDKEKDTLAIPSRRTKQTLVAFAQAIRDADAPRILELLKEDAVLIGDGGGKALTALNPIVGADKVSRFYLNVPRKLDPNFTFAPAIVNGAPGLVGKLNGKINFVMSLVIGRDGRIARILHMNNPDKLPWRNPGN